MRDSEEAELPPKSAKGTKPDFFFVPSAPLRGHLFSAVDHDGHQLFEIGEKLNHLGFSTLWKQFSRASRNSAGEFRMTPAALLTMRPAAPRGPEASPVTERSGLIELFRRHNLPRPGCVLLYGLHDRRSRWGWRSRIRPVRKAISSALDAAGLSCCFCCCCCWGGWAVSLMRLIRSESSSTDLASVPSVTASVWGLARSSFAVLHGGGDFLEGRIKFAAPGVAWANDVQGLSQVAPGVEGQ